MNILTFDIEEWFLEKELHGDRQERYREFDGYLSRILDLLDERDIQATFFCVGQMGVHFPHVIRRIAERGHEIGCHSDQHTWLNKMSREDAEKDTRTAIDALQQCIGKKVQSYRAPAFSIGGTNTWTFEVLAANGIECDASVYPARRDFGGFADFGYKSPVMIQAGDVKLKEFPICTTRILGHEMAFSGGGYFRFFPLWFVRNRMNTSDYNMCYFHIGDLIPESNHLQTREEYEAYFKEKGTWFNRYKRYFKSNAGKKHAFGKMEQLILKMPFMSIEKANREINWKEAPIVDLNLG